MLDSIATGVTSVIGYAGNVVTAIVGESGALNDLLPVVGMAIGIGLVGWGINTIKSITWGF